MYGAEGRRGHVHQCASSGRELEIWFLFGLVSDRRDVCMMEQERCQRCSAEIDTSEQVKRGQVAGILAGSGGRQQTRDMHSGEGETCPKK